MATTFHFYVVSNSTDSDCVRCSSITSKFRTVATFLMTFLIEAVEMCTIQHNIKFYILNCNVSLVTAIKATAIHRFLEVMSFYVEQKNVLNERLALRRYVTT